MKKASKILIVDDELATADAAPHGSYMWYYTQALRDGGFHVSKAQGPDDALEELSSKNKEVDLVILDIMMPPGKAYEKEDTLDGLRTGVFLAKAIQSRRPHLPILVLTNVQNPETLSQLRQIHSVKEILYKPDCTPFDLVDEVQSLGET
jgi:CheY-like chemotaxis protein